MAESLCYLGPEWRFHWRLWRHLWQKWRHIWAIHMSEPIFIQIQVISATPPHQDVRNSCIKTLKRQSSLGVGWNKWAAWVGIVETITHNIWCDMLRVCNDVDNPQNTYHYIIILCYYYIDVVPSHLIDPHTIYLTCTWHKCVSCTKLGREGSGNFLGPKKMCGIFWVFWEKVGCFGII